MAICGNSVVHDIPSLNMKIDWDKQSGQWNVFEESGVLLGKSPEVVILGTTTLIHDTRERHGWAIVRGKFEQRKDRIVIRKG